MLERDIAEYVLHHKEGLLKALAELSVEAQYNPILRTYLREAYLDEATQMIAQGMQLHYGEVAGALDHATLTNLLKESIV
jgi:hypothetical protein